MISLALFVLTAAELSRLSLGVFDCCEATTDALYVFSQGWFVLCCLIGWPNCSIRERTLIALAVGLTIALLGHPDFQAIVSSALGLAAFIGVFIAMLTVMKEAAARSGAVRDVGIHLTRQPANLRFLSVAWGSHVMGAFLNFAAPSLLAPMVQEGARHSRSEPPKIVEQRQLSALVRGFAWVILWAPTTLTQAILLGLFTGIDSLRLLGLGIFTSVIMIFAGLALDRHDWGPVQQKNRAGSPPRPTRAFLTLLVICTLLVAGTYGLKQIAGFSVAQSLVFSAPVTTMIWLAVQWPGLNLKRKLSNSLVVIAQASPSLMRSAIALGVSGYIGRVSVYLLPVQDIAAWMEDTALSPFLFLAALPIIITLGGQIALSPIIFVVFLGGVLSELPNYPADPTLTVLSLSFGWALSMTAAPNATATLILSASSGIPPTTLTWKWNSRYAVLCYFLFLVLIYLLTP